MAVLTNIARGRWFIGGLTTFRIDVVTVDANGDPTVTPQAMTGWSLQFVVRRPDASDTVLLTKTTGGSGVTIGNGAGTDDRATVTVDRADTLGWAEGSYLWTLWRTDSTNDVVLAYGRLPLTKAAAQ